MVAQTSYTGKVNLKKNHDYFNLVSSSDSYNVQINKKSLNFSKQNDFSFIKINRNNYNLVKDGDSIFIKDGRKQIEYSLGLTLYPVKKKRKQVILKDKYGNKVLDAKFNLKRSISDFNIAIFDEKHKTELLSYAAHYLYFKSKTLRDANNTPYIYFHLF